MVTKFQSQNGIKFKVFDENHTDYKSCLIANCRGGIMPCEKNKWPLVLQEDYLAKYNYKKYKNTFLEL